MAFYGRHTALNTRCCDYLVKVDPQEQPNQNKEILGKVLDLSNKDLTPAIVIIKVLESIDKLNRWQVNTLDGLNHTTML